MITRHIENTKPTIQMVLDVLRMLLGESGEIDVSIRPDTSRDPRIKLALGQILGKDYGVILGPQSNMKYRFTGDKVEITFSDPHPIGFGGPFEAEAGPIRVSLDEIYTVMAGMAPDIKLVVDS